MSTPIKIVKEFQLWRRGQGKYAGDVEPPDAEMPYSPAQYGEALDALIEMAERYEALRKAHADGLCTGDFAWCSNDAPHEWGPVSEPLEQIADNLRKTP